LAKKKNFMNPRSSHCLLIIITCLLVACFETTYVEPEGKGAPISVVPNGSTEADTAWFRLTAELYLRYDSYEEAATEYAKLIDYDSLNGEFHFKMANCLVKLGKHKESSKKYLKAAQLGYKPAEHRLH
jgi:tetratricopeptide (TPR) repeat protein